MKKMFAFVSLLSVGLLVGCGGEKPKVSTPDPAMIKAMKDKRAQDDATIEAFNKAANEAGKTVDGAVNDATEEIEKAADEGKKAVEGAEKAAKEEAEKVEGAVKEAAIDK